ncbi:MAG: chloride channel protein [Candidatus Edwardsbacteria bacterium]|nr:chloride channel protein [Candidatus Edwardsbacteria bacterium]MBU2463123.1 chloride channel protein [Candidatus Edwardsbacteria bacterium]
MIAKFKKHALRAVERMTMMGRPTRILLLGVGVGILTGLTAVAFRSLIIFSNSLFFPHDPHQIFLIGRWWRYLAFLIPAIGGLLVGGIMYLFFRKEEPLSGVPEVMAAVSLKGGMLSPKTGLKGLLSAITIGSGGSAGPEGPIVEIGSSLGSYLGQKLKLTSSELRLMAGCGAAAGISGVFGAPLGGVFFALEIILGEFAITTFAPVVLSAVAAAVISRTFLGDQPAFQVAAVNSLGSLYDIIPFLVLGLLSGLISVLFINTLYKGQSMFGRYKLASWLKPAAGGLMVGVLGMALPQVLGEGYHSVTAVLNGNILWWTALLLVFAKILATSLTLGSGAPGGSFAPAIFIGAMLGGAFGQLLAVLFPGFFVYNASYALAGAAGVVAGALNAPLTAGLIIFEITGTYKVVLPAMIVVAISAVITKRMKGSSVYTQAMFKAGLPVDQLRRHSHLSSATCRQAMKKDIMAILPQMSLHDIIKAISQTDQLILPVIDDNNKYLASVNWSQLRLFLEDEQTGGLIIAHDVMVKVPQVNADDSLSLALMYLIKNDMQEIPVVENGKLVGLIGNKEILRGGF